MTTCGLNSSGTMKSGACSNPGELLGPFGLAVADPGLREDVLDGRFEGVSDQAADRIPVAGEWAAKEALVEEHGIGSAHGREGFDGFETASGVGFLEAVDCDGVSLWASLLP